MILGCIHGQYTCNYAVQNFTPNQSNNSEAQQPVQAIHDITWDVHQSPSGIDTLVQDPFQLGPDALRRIEQKSRLPAGILPKDHVAKRLQGDSNERFDLCS